MESDSEKRPDPVAEFIVEALAEAGSLAPVDIARALGERRKRASDKPDAWRKYMNPVKQQMLHLARAGRIEIVRRAGRLPGRARTVQEPPHGAAPPRY